MLKSSLSDQNDAYILFKGKITFTAEGYDTAGRQVDERNEEARFKNCAPFTDSISQINYTQVDNAKDLDAVMSMCNLIEQEYNDNHSKSSGILWQYYRDEPALDNAGNIVKFPGKKFQFKFMVKSNVKNTDGGNTKDPAKAVPLKYLSTFWRNLEMLPMNCEINLILAWSATCFITNLAD